MMDSCYFCKTCYENNREETFKHGANDPSIDPGYCKIDKKKLEVISLTYDEYLTLWVVTKNNDLILAMNELKEKDPIEFQLKLADFEIKWQEMKKARDTTPKCPTCGSTNIQRISASSKAGSVFLFGLMSQKVKHQWHCNNCKYEW